MNHNRQGITKEVVIVILLTAAILATGGLLVANVVAAVRSLDGAQAERGPTAGDFEKALKDIAGKILPAEKKTAAPPPAPAAPAIPAAPGDAKTAAPAAKKAEVKGVKFYEAPREGVPANQRSYNTRFSRPRYIFTEISYKNNSHQVADAEIPLIIRYHDPAGQMVGEIRRTAQPKKEWASALFASGWGPAAPAQWQPGQYTVKLYVEGDFIGDFTFTIE